MGADIVNIKEQENDAAKYFSLYVKPWLVLAHLENPQDFPKSVIFGEVRAKIPHSSYINVGINFD